MAYTDVEYSGHIYYGTRMAAYECTDDCGTCDGARCYRCRKVYKTYDDNGVLVKTEYGSYLCPEELR